MRAKTCLLAVVPIAASALFAACSAEGDRAETPPPPPTTSAGQSRPWLNEVAPYMKRVAAAGFHGSIVVADETGAVLFENAYGLADVANNTPFTPETAVNIGSTRKAYISAVIMSLVDEGVLAVDKPIAHYMPDAPADKAQITPHQLLTHTSGLGDEFGSPLDEIDRDDLVRRIFSSTLIFEPGAGYAYSDMGYALLQAIAEKAAGVLFRRLVRERIVAPLGLRHTGFLDEPAWSFNGGDAPVALGYANDREDKTEAQYRRRDGWSPLGAGPMLSTPRDAVVWMRALIEGRIVSPASVDRIFARHIETIDGRVWYGYGWNIVETEDRGRVFGHGGATNSHNFYVQYLKDDGLYIAAASNRIGLKTADINNDGDINDDGEIRETLYAPEVAGGLARAIHQRDFSVLPRFMQGSSARDG